jgi:putative endonuclease
MDAPHLALGSRGETLAVAALERAGYAVIATGYRTAAGEIDIVARDGPCLVFVEVKTRRTK